VPAPRTVRWTDHGLAKADRLGFARGDVEDAILTHHAERTRNTGAADWLLSVGALVIAYNYPDGDDTMAARVVTVWRRG
jgi:hypothetical protein